MKSDKIHSIANYDDERDGKPGQEPGSYTRDSHGWGNKGGTYTKFMYAVDKERAASRFMKLSIREDIAHELKHAWNILNKCTGNSTFGKSGVSLEEIDGVNFQNIVRAAEHKLLRVTYGDINVEIDLTCPEEYKLQQKKQ